MRNEKHFTAHLDSLEALFGFVRWKKDAMRPLLLGTRGPGAARIGAVGLGAEGLRAAGLRAAGTATAAASNQAADMDLITIGSIYAATSTAAWL